jgi:hypothetical protein
MKQLKFTDHRGCWKCCSSTRRYLSQLIISLKKGPTILLALQHNRHQLSLDGAGLRGLDVDSVNSVAIILRNFVSLQVKPRFMWEECQLRIDWL